MSINNKVGVLSLSAAVISAMIGGGVYNLPQNMAQEASAGAILIAWVITGAGMWFIANTFCTLADIQPEMTDGIYGYGDIGFGRLTGFLMAWGYWLCNICSNIGFAVLMMGALNYFFPPYLKGGNTVYAVIGGSIVIWCMHFVVLAGIKESALLNNIAVIGKLVPLFIFILIMLYLFDSSLFTRNFWVQANIPDVQDKHLGSVFEQIKSTMMMTLWVFIGVEGASVIAIRARSQRDVRSATLVGFITCLILYALLSLLPLGVLTQEEISIMRAPSTGVILGKTVGYWGAILMNTGVLVSVLSCWLVWTVMLISMPYEAALDGTFPKVFATENKNETPSFSLLVSSILMQGFMVIVYFADNAWNLMLSITGVMVLPCYLVCTLYLWKLSRHPESLHAISQKKVHRAMKTGILGSIYAAWLIYAAGLTYMMVAAVIYALGLPLFWWARKESNDQSPLFISSEKVWMGTIGSIAVAGAIYCVKNAHELLG
ncbi:basic amino acid/polyamine antiporter [uncultured Endozoicomonas sp.]|uniref:basic amino acid/polyamine antiporter n=1 Tax=uncultured Endozoicomonas sp. TaxID=432652 RepID=UPI00261A7E70|nr:basic amino acid/polyamine antiporter [uncultured Endozoicomonas sp.]